MVWEKAHRLAYVKQFKLTGAAALQEFMTICAATSICCFAGHRAGSWQSFGQALAKLIKHTVYCCQLGA